MDISSIGSIRPTRGWGEIDGRPSIAPLGDAAPAAVSRNGKLEVKLKPWSSMVLSGY
jgi:hypothetical protein